jgi:hypothetical protein
LTVRPGEGMAKISGQGGLLFGWKTAAIGQRFATTHAGPETAIGKAVG